MFGRRGRLASIASALRWRPEWPYGLLVALSWLGLAVISFRIPTPEGTGIGVDPGGPPTSLLETAWVCLVGGRQAPGQGAPLAAGFDARIGTFGSAAAVAGDVAGTLPAWTLMAVAMMAATALPAVRHVGLNSLRVRRRRAMSLTFGTYVGVWVVFGGFALAALEIAVRGARIAPGPLLSMTLTVAAIWQLTRFKRQALSTCRRSLPLPPVGLRADAACIRFALLGGSRCVRSCWALMLVATSVGHGGLLAMASLSALVVIEELTSLGRSVLAPSAAALALTAGLVAVGS